MADDNDLAKQLANPISSLISVPFQFNFDDRIGPARRGDRLTLNIQPVIPFSLNSDWNLISRTITPLVWQSDIFPGAGAQQGAAQRCKACSSLRSSRRAAGSSGVLDPPSPPPPPQIRCLAASAGEQAQPACS
jgi:hypothetical protein